MTDTPHDHASPGSTPGQAAPAIQWRLHELMAAHGIRFASQLHARLAAVLGDDAPGEGQVRKLVRRTPDRLTLKTLAGLCQVLECEPGDLLSLWRECSLPRRTRGRPR